jgi:hypothetical protein
VEAQAEAAEDAADAAAGAALRNALYQLHMANGRQAHAARRYPDAARSFEEALKLVPTSAEARSALERARQHRP